MIPVISEILDSVDGNHQVSFAVYQVIYDDKDGLFKTHVEFVVNGKRRVQSIKQITQTAAFVSALTYIGINIRASAKDLGTVFDLHGMTYDEFIPLNAHLRGVWDE